MFIVTEYAALIFNEKGIGVHVQRMLKMSRVYTLTEILSKIFVKTKENWGSYLQSWLTNKRFGDKLIFIKIYYIMRSLLARFTSLHFETVDKYRNGKLSKMGLFRFFFKLYYYELCHHRSTKSVY